MDSKRNREHFRGRDEDDGLLLPSIDWPTLLELSALCPTTFAGHIDDDLDRIYALCEHGCSIEGRVFF